MSNVDENQLELIERRLTEKVEVQVRARLFKVYALVGGAVIAVLSFVGYDLFATLKTRSIEAAQAKAREDIEPLVDESRKVLKNAEARSNDATVTLQIARERLNAVDESLARGEQRIAKVVAQVAEASARYNREVTALEAKLGDIRTRTERAASEIEAQRERASALYADAGSLADLANSVETLTNQVRALDKQVKEIADRARIDTRSAGASETELEKVADSAMRQSVPAASARLTVFFQFAILPRDQARTIAQALRNRGYKVPGEDREEAATNLREVRYFFQSDEPAAKHLASQTRDVLAHLGYGDIAMKVKDLTSYRGTKPRPGVLELWLGLQPLQ